MNDLVFNGGYAPLSSGDISDFENRMNVTLPSKYRSFMLRVNGGIPHKHLIDGCYIQYLCAITDASKAISLEREMSSINLPKELIAIGYCSGGDHLCVSLSDDKIYLWEREADYADSSDWPALAEMTCLAGDIEELLNRLEGEDPGIPDEEVDAMGRWGRIDVLDRYLATGRDINGVSPSGHAIVRSAVYDGNLEFVKACAKRGAVLKHLGLLHAAQFTMNEEMVKYLLEQGVSPNELDKSGRTPLDCAPRGATGPSVQLLIQAGGIKSRESA